MKKGIFSVFALVLFLGLFLINSCKVSDILPPDTQTANDCARAEGAVTEVFGVANTNSLGGGKSLQGSECYTVSAPVVVGNDKKITITFPSTGCVGANGNVRKGEITVQYASNWRASILLGTLLNTPVSMTITFNGYSFKNAAETGENQISGSYKIDYLGFVNSKPNFHITTPTPLTFKYADNKTLTMNIDNTVVWLEGFGIGSLIDGTDDSFRLNGTNSGVARNGSNYTYTATELVTLHKCKFPVSGSLTIKEGDKEGTLKFGNAGATDCPTSLTYTSKSGQSITIPL